MRTIDLRSDTVSQPTAAMRERMAAAEVGDDCYGDDPSVLALERRIAWLLGKPAALWVPTGTMANQLAVACHARPGQTLACAPEAHVQVHEDGSAARLSGVQVMPIGSGRGFSPTELRALLREESCGWPPTGLVWVENTLGLAGGRIWPLAEVAGVADVARAHGKPMHLDGARLWNAHVATGTPLASWAELADSVSVSLSKGLGCPAGSVLVGTEDFVAEARGLRHGFGGSMRQVGVLAAAGLHALDHHVARLADDHRRAHRLWERLHELPLWSSAEPETNIVLFALVNDGAAEDVCAPIRAAGVLCYPNKFNELRLVVHLGVDDADVEEAVDRICRLVG